MCTVHVVLRSKTNPLLGGVQSATCGGGFGFNLSSDWPGARFPLHIVADIIFLRAVMEFGPLEQCCSSSRPDPGAGKRGRPFPLGNARIELLRHVLLQPANRSRRQFYRGREVVQLDLAVQGGSRHPAQLQHLSDVQQERWS